MRRAPNVVVIVSGGEVRDYDPSEYGFEHQWDTLGGPSQGRATCSACGAVRGYAPVRCPEAMKAEGFEQGRA